MLDIRRWVDIFCPVSRISATKRRDENQCDSGGSGQSNAHLNLQS
jgi:hypothetical protein